MKKILITGSFLVFTAFTAFVNAQDVSAAGKEKEKNKVKETEEIVIRNKGDQDMKITVEVDGDKVTVNGKPMSEFNDKNITINKRKMIIRDGDNVMSWDMDGDMKVQGFPKNFAQSWGGNDMKESKAFLGVTTEKADGGAKIMEVTKGSAAEKAGLKKDDIITKVNDKDIEDGAALSDAIGDLKPKETAKITYKRNGKESTAKATLGERKVSKVMTYNFRNGDAAPRARVFNMPATPGAPNIQLFNDEDVMAYPPGDGLAYTPYNIFGRQKKIGLKIQDTEEGGNVKVIDVDEGSAAEKAGLKKDDIITEIAGKKVSNTDDAREQLNPEEAKSSYTLRALRDGKEMSFVIKIPKKLKTATF